MQVRERQVSTSQLWQVVDFAGIVANVNTKFQAPTGRDIRHDNKRLPGKPETDC
jgi:hypothetical protein